MNHNKKQTLPLILSMVLTILLITTGLSFAYFSANITGTEETTTIQASGGVMNIHYSGGENINTPNIFPSNVPFATKDFTLTGNSTTNDNMNYHIILVIEENTFTGNALTYKLTSDNTNNNGEVAPSTNQVGIVHGAHELFLGDGIFESPSNNDLHSYTLELYFPDTEQDQNDDMNKTFKAYINIREDHYVFPGYNVEKGVNHPVLFTGMTPIKWDSEFNEIETNEEDSDWYNYDEKRWANAKSLDGSYWVWIPRYAYKITSGYHSNETGTIDVKFLKGKSISTIDGTIVETKGYEPGVKDTSMYYFLHPAFDFDDGYFGFWMAKFEPTAAEGVASGTDSCDDADNKSTKTPKIIPSITSWRCINIANAYEASLKMKSNQVYGWFSKEVDTHMMTNHQWGAVTYLSSSQYGAPSEVWINNSNNYITGCAGNSEFASAVNGCENAYHTEYGQKASTTHNIYGVYDMSGGAIERVMGNLDNIVGASGFDDEYNLGLICERNLTRYTSYDGPVYGDAVYETSLYSSETTSWYGDTSVFLYKSYYWFARGGHSGEEVAGGIFNFAASAGSRRWSNSFRPVLIPLS